MWLRVLGSAAGGGSPQWNCGCPVCAAVRAGAAPVRTQSSVAVSADRERWFLINASPDVRGQVEAFPDLHPRGGRATPLEAVLLTDAELDHALGLLLLREARGVRVYATPATYQSLSDGSGLLRTLERYCPVEWRAVLPGTDLPLGGGLTCRAFDVPTSKRDRFAAGCPEGVRVAAGGDGRAERPRRQPARPRGPGTGRVVGYRLTDARTGGTLVYLPCAQALPPPVLAEIEGCDCLLVDGTCWSDDELARLGLAGRTSREMGHLPMDGPDGSLARLRELAPRRVVFVHMNNTNPVLLPDSPQRRLVESGGMEVAVDGLEVEV